jgi:hypothetical protein
VGTVPSHEMSSRTMRLSTPDTATVIQTRFDAHACLQNLGPRTP